MVRVRRYSGGVRYSGRMCAGYLTKMLTPVNDDPGRRRLRSAARGDTVVPRAHAKMLGQSSFVILRPVFCYGLFELN